MLKVTLTGSWKHDRASNSHGEWCWLRPVSADQSEQTGCSGGGGVLKRQELNQSVSDRAAAESEQTDVLFLALKQNELMKLKMSRIRLL